MKNILIILFIIITVFTIKSCQDQIKIIEEKEVSKIFKIKSIDYYF